MSRHEGTAFVSLLRTCAKNKDLSTGTRIHHHLLKRGLLDMCLDPLVTMYAKCGQLATAKTLLDLHKSRNVFSWTALIAGYTQNGQAHDALNCFEQMQHEGLSPDAVTFACTLKACGSIQAHEKGQQIHDELVRQGLLRDDIVLGNALVDMYAKCGALAKAQRVLEELPVRDVVSWSALIAGYAQYGLAEQAMNCFQLMKSENLSPDAVTFVCILKACGSIRAADKGEKIHNEISKQGLLENNIMLGNALVDMYAKCGAFVKAKQVLEELPIQNVVSWNALIAGYTQKGQAEQALQSFERMKHEGLSPNAVTFLCILKACGSIGEVEKGEQFHNEISKEGLLRSNIELGNAVVDMYIKFGTLAKAQQVLEELPVRNVVSWSTLISGYAEQGQGGQALRCFERMQREGFSPNAITFLCLLKACGSIGATDRGEQIHDEIARQGLLENDVVLGTALVDMYAKCGALEKAQQVLKELPVQNVVSWNALITGYVQQGQAHEALYSFERMQHEGLSPDSVTLLCIMKACGSIKAVDKGEQIHDEIARQGLLGNNVVLGNAVVDMYAKCGALEKARQVLEGLSVRDVVSWSALIQGYAQHSQGEQAIDCFERMKGEGISPNGVTFLCILKACGSIGAVDKGEQIHYEIARQGLLENDIVVGTAVVDMYCKCGALGKAQGVLEKLPVRNVVSWTALITGYVEQGQAEQALNCFEWMQREGLSPDAVTFLSILKVCGSIGAVDKGEKIHEEIAKKGWLGHHLMLGNALVDMYSKCGALTKAQQVLEDLPVRDAVSWSALIAGYAQQGQADQALNCFERMQGEGFYPDAVTFACILKICGSIGAADKGEQIHDEISRQGLLGNNVVLGNALMNMYAKCGALAKAQLVHEELCNQSVASWNALIAGYAQHGQGEQALEYFEGMQHAGLSPDGMTLLSVLKACGILGLVDKAELFFSNMSTKHGIKADLEHYTCMIDVFGRAGHLDKAVEVIQKMPSFENSLTLWCAVLGACRKWGDVNIGRWAFEHAVQVDRNDAAAYVLMANIYAAAGMHKDAEKIETMRVVNEAWKKPAHSQWRGMSGNASCWYDKAWTKQI